MALLELNKPRRMVLDTNVLLDWLFFTGADVALLLAHAHSQSIQLISSTACIAEFARVLAYPQFNLNPYEQAERLATYMKHVVCLDMPNEASLIFPLRLLPQCRDGDDQKFLELAYHHHADFLISKDKRVLKMRKHKKFFQFKILTPLEYLRQMA